MLNDYKLNCSYNPSVKIYFFDVAIACFMQPTLANNVQHKATIELLPSDAMHVPVTRHPAEETVVSSPAAK